MGLGPSGAALGCTWPAFGLSWAALGPSWELLGRVLDVSWALLGACWLLRPSPASILGGLGDCGAGFWRASGARFGMPFAAPCIHNIMFLLMQYPRFCIYLRFAFFPSGAAVCAPHMEFSPVDPESMPVIAFGARFCASCWLIFRSLSLLWPLLASFLVSLRLSDPIFINFFDFLSPGTLPEPRKSTKKHLFS